jgi:hypothetical protein
MVACCIKKKTPADYLLVICVAPSRPWQIVVPASRQLSSSWKTQRNRPNTTSSRCPPGSLKLAWYSTTEVTGAKTLRGSIVNVAFASWFPQEVTSTLWLLQLFNSCPWQNIPALVLANVQRVVPDSQSDQGHQPPALFHEGLQSLTLMQDSNAAMLPKHALVTR